jgi:hypothetical protein
MDYLHIVSLLDFWNAKMFSFNAFQQFIGILCSCYFPFATMLLFSFLTVTLLLAAGIYSVAIDADS